MGQRLQLQTLLESLPGVEKVYFQSPPPAGMVYPCILYSRGRSETEFADDRPYAITKRYILTVMDRDPDSSIPDEVAQLPGCTHDRFYTADGLNHHVYQIYF